MTIPTYSGVYASGTTAAAAGTTLNPLDKASSITLSNGNLRATRNSVTAPRWVMARATTSKTSGKWYFEATNVNLNDAATGVVVGVVLGSQAVDNGGQCFPGHDLQGVGCESVNGAVLRNTNVQATISTWGSAGNVVQVAVDMNATRIWFRKVGTANWNGSGTADPATNTGGILLNSGGNAMYPAVAANSDAPPDAITINFGASAFSGTAPAGFSAWG